MVFLRITNRRFTQLDSQIFDDDTDYAIATNFKSGAIDFKSNMGVTNYELLAHNISCEMRVSEESVVLMQAV